MFTWEENMPLEQKSSSRFYIFKKYISEKYNTDDKKNDDDAKPEQILYLKSLLQNIELSTTKLNRFLDYLNHIKVTPKVYKRSNIVR